MRGYLKNRYYYLMLKIDRRKNMTIGYTAWLVSIIITMFFLGGKWSPLWSIKLYRKFMVSIGMSESEEF